MAEREHHAPACSAESNMPLPKKTVFQSCDRSRVADLERSFLAAWKIICPKQTEAGSTREAELRIEKLAARGFKNTDELTKRCVEELLLGPRS